MTEDARTAAYARRTHNTLIIGNQWMERRFAARVGEPFLTAAFVNKLSSRDYSRPGGREFCFSVDGRAVSGADFNLAKVENLRKVTGASILPSQRHNPAHRLDSIRHKARDKVCYHPL